MNAKSWSDFLQEADAIVVNLKRRKLLRDLERLVPPSSGYFSLSVFGSAEVMPPVSYRAQFMEPLSIRGGVS